MSKLHLTAGQCDALLEAAEHYVKRWPNESFIPCLERVIDKLKIVSIHAHAKKNFQHDKNRAKAGETLQTHQTRWRHDDDGYRAICACGWEGNKRLEQRRAKRDGDDHASAMARIGV